MSDEPPTQWGQPGPPHNPYGDQPDPYGQQPNPYQQPAHGQQPQPQQWGQQQWGQPGQQQWDQPGQQQWGQQEWGQPGGPPPQGPQRPNRRNLWLALVGVAVVVAGGVTVAVLALGGDDDKDKDSSSDDSSQTESEESGSSEPSDDPTSEASSADATPVPVESESPTPAAGGVLFTFPEEFQGRTLSATSADRREVTDDDLGFGSVTYEGSEPGDILQFQYLTGVTPESYGEIAGTEPQQVGDATCFQVLEGTESYACMMSLHDGVLMVTSNFSTVKSAEQTAAVLQEMHGQL